MTRIAVIATLVLSGCAVHGADDVARDLRAMRARWKTDEQGEITELVIRSTTMPIRFSQSVREKLSHSLTYLDLRGTLADNTTLRQLRGFTRLKRLVVANTSVTNKGMQHIASIAQLEELDLGGLRSVTNDGVSQLRMLSLKQLSMAGCSMMTDNVFSSISKMPLEVLSLNATQIGNSGLASLSNLRLKKLDLSYTNVNDLSVVISRLPELKTLVVAGCPIGNRGLGTAWSIEDLIAFSTRITRLGSKHKVAHRLVINGNDSILSSISQHPSLKILELSGGSEVTADALRRCQLPALESLSLVNCFKVRQLPLSGFSKLRELSIFDLNLSAELVKEIASCVDLERLRMWESRVTFNNAALKQLKELKRLKSLNVSLAYPHDNAILSAISEISSLRSLNLNYCDADEFGFRHLKKLKLLEDLTIYSNIDGIRNAEIAALLEIERLRRLTIKATTHLTSASASLLLEHPTLEFIDISNSSIDDEVVARLQAKLGTWNVVYGSLLRKE